LELFGWALFVFSLGILGYASLQDVRCRQVSNCVWVIGYPIGSIITLAALAAEPLRAQVVCLSLGFAVGLGLVLFCLGFYGGADVKALIFVGLAAPLLPLSGNVGLGFLDLPLVLVVFCYASLLSLVWPLAIFILNLKDALRGHNMFGGIKLSVRKKVWLLFTARKVPLEKLKSLRYFPAERVVFQEGEPARMVVHFVKAETDLEKYFATLEKHQTLYQKGILASPTIPTIVFLTLAMASLPLLLLNLVFLGANTLFF
jgi:Flp pilus assembly protein protease CpaA